MVASTLSTLSRKADEPKKLSPTPAEKRAQARHLLVPPPTKGELIEDDDKKGKLAKVLDEQKQKNGNSRWKGSKSSVSSLTTMIDLRREMRSHKMNDAARAGYQLQCVGVCEELADLIYSASLNGEVDKLLEEALAPALVAAAAAAAAPTESEEPPPIETAGKGKKGAPPPAPPPAEEPLPIVNGPFGPEPLAAEWRVRDPFGMEPLAKAASSGFSEVAQLLLRVGATVDAAAPHCGRTALHR